MTTSYGSLLIITSPFSIRLTVPEVNYILEHSGSKILLVDHEFQHLARDSRLPVIISSDTGRSNDPYEQFLAAGRTFSQEQGWAGLDFEPNEDAAASLCYTWVDLFYRTPHLTPR
jgi:long-subunit acyl-CoA synthetase (AMP-forming)